MVIKLHSLDTGLFTANFCSVYRGIHFVSHKQKVNVSAIPGVGVVRFSNDW